tara:strand:- start:562 stop:735 length:174 start_codon:yes stop_codon:yes gene_type:complete
MMINKTAKITISSTETMKCQITEHAHSQGVRLSELTRRLWEQELANRVPAGTGKEIK